MRVTCPDNLVLLDLDHHNNSIF